VTGDHRLLLHFVEDGALVSKGWIEAAGTYARVDGGSDIGADLRAAFRFGRNVEAGLTARALMRSRDAGQPLFGATLASEVDATGLADPQLYGKYRLLRSPVEVSLGAIASLPLGDERSGLGPGSFGYRAFLGLRRGFPGATLVGSLGAASQGASKAAGRDAGRTSGLLGFGLLVPLSYEWTFLAEVNYEGARFKDQGQDIEALAGMDWRPAENIVVRGGMGAGLTDAAPSVLAVLSAAFHF